MFGDVGSSVALHPSPMNTRVPNVGFALLRLNLNVADKLPRYESRGLV